MQLIYHPEAEAELIQAIQFYEGRVPRLGVQFLEAADRAISLIVEAPDRWRIVEADVRRYLMPCFPYAILPYPTRTFAISCVQASSSSSGVLALSSLVIVSRPSKQTMKQ
jgi:hypothetical protein